MADFENVFAAFDNVTGTSTISDMPGKNNGKRLLALFIIDATKSMEGTAIGQVNYALAELVSDMKSFASDNMLNMDLAVMSFSNSIKWELKPEDINNCLAVPQINVRPGNTQYGVVYHELNKMLNKNNLLRSTGKQAAPVIVFLTDGAPVDDYKYDLEELKKNGYFMLANRAAVIMGEGANNPEARAAVADFTMDEKMVLTTDNTSEIVNAIKLATLHTLKGTEIRNDPSINPGDVPPSENPFGDDPEPTPIEDPFKTDPGPMPPTEDPFGTDPGPTLPTEDPFGSDPGTTPPSKDPFGSDPGTTPPTEDPFGSDPGTTPPVEDPFGTDPGTTPPVGDPFGDEPVETPPLPLVDDPFADL